MPVSEVFTRATLPCRGAHGKTRAVETTDASGTSRPFRVLGVQQLAVGGTDKARLRHLWCDLLGLARTGEFRSERENVDEDITVAGRGPFAVEVDLMVPLDPDKKPRVNEPPLNHVGLWVDDLHAAVAWLEAQGVRFAPGGIRRGAAGFDVTFIHPRGSETHPQGGEGVLLELVQAPPAVIAAFDALASAGVS
jgi:lactoylglutathione lyase